MSSIFGKDFQENWPAKDPILNDFSLKLLEECKNVKKPTALSVKELMAKSNQFPLMFPIETCKIYKQPDKVFEIFREQIESTYPVIHERVVWLYIKFLEHKRNYGTKIEKEIYHNMSLSQFIDRLLLKRCATFYMKNDKYLLLSGEKGASGFVEIGTDVEKPPLVLRNCLSYDEIKLSALLSVSSYTQFLNNGTRKNMGIPENDKTKIEENGIVIGIIGARLSRRDLMEFQDIIISKTQNTAENGYGISRPPADSVTENTKIDKNFNYRQIWNQFYDESGKLFINVKRNGERFGDSKNKNDIFDSVLMKKRYTISFDTLLLESESRAAASAGKSAYIHVVGIGLGVWKTADQQEAIFFETFAQRLEALKSVLKHVSCVHFSWFKLEQWGVMRDGYLFKDSDHPEGGIKVRISKRNPADKLPRPEQENSLLVVSYAWDGNALPGNEFWVGLISSTGDSSTASSTLVAELHNPHINTGNVCGDNLHVASAKHGGVLHISDYAKSIL